MASKRLNKTIQILALHGFTGCGADFVPFSPLCGSEYAWSCPDLPGHGPAPQLNCTPEAIVQFLDQSRLARPRVLLGYSMGARAALLHALSRPTHWDALILISASPGIDDASTRSIRAASDCALARQLVRGGVAAFLQEWQQTPMIQSQRHIRADWQLAMQRNRAQHTARGLATSLEQFGPAVCPNLWPRLHELSCPILSITGGQDHKYRHIAKRMLPQLRQAQEICIPNVGHMPHLEAPDASVAAIRSFLSPQ